jgi:hypothetical protein
MELDEARRTFRATWTRRTRSYNLSATDSYTDGFWDGRLWAAARLVKTFSELDRARVIELLGIYDREAKEAGL